MSSPTVRTTAVLVTSAALATALLLFTRCESSDARLRMVEEQIVSPVDGRAPVQDPRVLAAMRAVPRHRFVPAHLQDRAYTDRPLPIAGGQTISQPYIVAYMTEALQLGAGDKVLEIGTGSGYQAAVLAEIVEKVYTIEIIDDLAAEAAERLTALGYDNVEVRAGDGYRGWPEQAPFDAIMVTAAPNHVPEPLVEQLAVGGRLILPEGDWDQQLVLLTKTEDGIERRNLQPVRFVEMTGEAARRRR